MKVAEAECARLYNLHELRDRLLFRRSSLFSALLSQEIHQRLIHLFRMRPRNVVRPILHDQLSAFHQLGGSLSCRREGNNPVCIAVNHQRRHIDFRDILPEIFMPRRHAGQTRDRRREARLPKYSVLLSNRRYTRLVRRSGLKEQDRCFF